MQSPIGQQAMKNIELAQDCAQYALLFFNSTVLNLENAKHGSFTLMPTTEMQKILQKDYAAMSGMIFGEKPTFELILKAINHLEKIINEDC